MTGNAAYWYAKTLGNTRVKDLKAKKSLPGTLRHLFGPAVSVHRRISAGGSLCYDAGWVAMVPSPAGFVAAVFTPEDLSSEDHRAYGEWRSFDAPDRLYILQAARLIPTRAADEFGVLAALVDDQQLRPVRTVHEKRYMARDAIGPWIAQACLERLHGSHHWDENAITTLLALHHLDTVDLVRDNVTATQALMANMARTKEAVEVLVEEAAARQLKLRNGFDAESNDVLSPLLCTPYEQWRDIMPELLAEVAPLPAETDTRTATPNQAQFPLAG